MELGESFAALDRLIHGQQHSEAVMLALQLLQQGIDHELVEDELCFSLAEFASQLVALRRIESADWLWRKSLDLCLWKSDVLLHGYSKFKLSINEILQGIDLIHDTFSTRSPAHHIPLPVAESLENMKALVADQWHYRMLNDLERNEAYDRALRRALQLLPGAVVLDIGGGTGLLSMFAARAGAAHVYCCEVRRESGLGVSDSADEQ